MKKKCEDGHYEIWYNSQLDLTCPLCNIKSGDNYYTRDEISSLIEEESYSYQERITELEIEIEESYDVIMTLKEKLDEAKCAIQTETDIMEEE